VVVGQGIHRLTQGVVNFYLVEDGGKFLLIDAGAPKDWDLLVNTMSDLGRQLTDLEAVLLTHAHSDHTGFAERARTTVPASVWIHQADAEVARTGKPGKNDGRVTSYLLRAEFYKTTFSLIWRGAGRIVPIHEVSTFSDGETIDVPGRPRALHTPGHTPGSAVLLLEERRAVVTGDALATRNPLTGRMGPQIMPSGLNGDTPQALRSLGVLEGIQAETILPGHGDPWKGSPTEAVRMARAAGRS
jgi:glyoxylase-like metal-dependent hydrolase (beta-lactamase superfamily II)